MYKGDLEGFPKEIVEKMLDRQEEQGNRRDVKVFEENRAYPLSFNGFKWCDTIEGFGFWGKVIEDKNFGVFYDRYPKVNKDHEGNNITNWGGVDFEGEKDNFLKDASLYSAGIHDLYKSVLKLNESGLMDSYIFNKKPKTAEERDQLIKELQAIEFKKELPSELDKIRISHITIHIGCEKKATLIVLLEMRNVYRDGWVARNGSPGFCIDYDFNDGFNVEGNNIEFLSLFSFQNQETAELFLNNFREELDSVKSLIS